MDDNIPVKSNTNIKNRKSYIAKLLFKAIYYKIKGDDSSMMTTVADGFLDLGGVYVKFLQGVLLQLPMMKLWKGDRRFDVYENVPIDDININQLLKHELTSSQIDKIKEVDRKPFASGSFGQVYRARLISGELIVIKALRPNITKSLKRDLRFINFLSKLVAGVFTSWNVDLRSISRSFVKSTLAETDYISEAKFAAECYKYYQDSETIVIPKTYLEISNKNLIVQEYIEGVSLAQMLRNGDLTKSQYSDYVFFKTGSDMARQLTNLGVELNKTVLQSGPIHGDPHPGNIRLLPDNKVALLDFGIHAKPLKTVNAYFAVLKEFWQAEYLNKPDPGNMFVAYIRFYSGRLYESMQIVSEYATKRYQKQINLDQWIIKLSNKLFDQKVSPELLLNGLDRIRAGEGAKDISVDSIVNPGNRFQIAIKIDDGAILRTMATYISLVTELGFRKLIPDVYNEIVVYVEENMPEVKVLPEPTLRLEEAMEIVYGWLNKVARTDSDLYRLMLNYLQGQS